MAETDQFDYELVMESFGEKGRIRIKVESDNDELGDDDILREAISVLIDQLYDAHDRLRKDAGLDEYEHIEESFAGIIEKVGELIKLENPTGQSISAMDAVKLFIEQYK